MLFVKHELILGSVCILGGLAEEVDDKILHAAFIPFGDVIDIQIPLDYETRILLLYIYLHIIFSFELYICMPRNLSTPNQVSPA